MLRYRYFVSKTLILFFNPIYNLSQYLIVFISRSIKINGRTITYSGYRIKFPKNVGINFSTQVFWNGTEGVEPLTVRTLIPIFRNFDIFLDVGSNFGIYSVIAQKANQNMIVFCFEPLQNIYKDNLRFHNLNGCNNQYVLNMAVSNVMDDVNFYVPDVFHVASETSSATVEENFSYNKKFPQKKIIVKSITLDKIVELFSSLIEGKKVVVKMDIEGHECSALSGGLNFLNQFRPWIVVEIDRVESNLILLEKIISDTNYFIYCMVKEGYFKLSFASLLSFSGDRDFLLIPKETPGIMDYFSFEQMTSLLKSFSVRSTISI